MPIACAKSLMVACDSTLRFLTALPDIKVVVKRLMSVCMARSELGFELRAGLSDSRDSTILHRAHARVLRSCERCG